MRYVAYHRSMLHRAISTGEADAATQDPRLRLHQHQPHTMRVHEGVPAYQHQQHTAYAAGSYGSSYGYGYSYGYPLPSNYVYPPAPLGCSYAPPPQPPGAGVQDNDVYPPAPLGYSDAPPPQPPGAYR